MVRNFELIENNENLWWKFWVENIVQNNVHKILWANLYSKLAVAHILCKKLGHWMDGWVGGWMGGWMGEAGLKIAYSNQKLKTSNSFSVFLKKKNAGVGGALHTF